MPVLLLSALLHYAAGRLLLRTQSRRAVVAAVVVLDLGLLAACKYLDFLCAAVSMGLGLFVFKKNQDKFVLYM